MGKQTGQGLGDLHRKRNRPPEVGSLLYIFGALWSSQRLSERIS